MLAERVSLWSLLGLENVGFMFTGVVFLILHISSEWMQYTPGEAKKMRRTGQLNTLRVLYE